MPVEPKGFFYKHWEKLVLGAVVLGAAVAGYFAYERATLSQEEDPRDDVKQLTQQLEGALKSDAEISKPKDFVNMLASHYGTESLPQPPIAPGWSFWPPLPSIYSTVRVGTNETLTLRFDSSLESAELVDAPNGVRIEHPVGADYQLVKVDTTGIGEQQQARFRIVGTTSRGRMVQKHIRPVMVGPGYVGKVKPPTEFTVESQVGRTLIRFRSNPANRGAGVDAYVVYRKRAGALTGGFEKIGEIQSRSGQGDNQQQRSYEQPDYGVKPGRAYVYKVRTLASQAAIGESDFTDPVEAEAKRQVGWTFSYQVPRGIRFELIRVTPDGQQQNQIFIVDLGEEIGGTSENRQGEFLTGEYLVDYHDRARSEQEGDNPVTGRIVYQDHRGNLRVRWRSRSPSDLWER